MARLGWINWVGRGGDEAWCSECGKAYKMPDFVYMLPPNRPRCPLHRGVQLRINPVHKVDGIR